MSDRSGYPPLEIVRSYYTDHAGSLVHQSVLHLSTQAATQSLYAIGGADGHNPMHALREPPGQFEGEGGEGDGDGDGGDGDGDGLGAGGGPGEGDGPKVVVPISPTRMSEKVA